MTSISDFLLPITILAEVRRNKSKREIPVRKKSSINSFSVRKDSFIFRLVPWCCIKTNILSLWEVEIKEFTGKHPIRAWQMHKLNVFQSLKCCLTKQKIWMQHMLFDISGKGRAWKNHLQIKTFWKPGLNSTLLQIMCLLLRNLFLLFNYSYNRIDIVSWKWNSKSINLTFFFKNTSMDNNTKAQVMRSRNKPTKSISSRHLSLYSDHFQKHFCAATKAILTLK